MIEVEVKARAREDTAEKIRALGAVLVAVENHHDLYFNSPQRDFKKTDEALRIRIKEEGPRLTYKGPKLDGETKSRKELTVKIDDLVQMRGILESLGFVLSAEVKKRRTKYSYGRAIFALDEVEGLGSFLEIEAQIDAQGNDDFAAQKDLVQSLLRKLDLGESIRSSYLELLEDKLRNR
ncbi:MAG: class IV adenylate cyclase [Methanothrix sp.]|nr:MAG: class IV adenylate cyclase [Methanothrix sp.]